MRRSRFHNLLKDSVFAAMCLRHKMSPVFYFNVKKKKQYLVFKLASLTKLFGNNLF